MNHGRARAAPAQLDQASALHEARLDEVCRRLRASGARRVIDLGCGSGQLLHRLAREPWFEEIVGVDACALTLAQARAVLREQLRGPAARLRLLSASYTEPLPELVGYDAAAMVETIEHLPPTRLSAAERVVFGQLRPTVVYLTTPNREYNPLLDLAPGQWRDPDHRFEWCRAKFRQWAQGVARRNGYRVILGGIGEEDPELGPPTQTAYFSSLTAD